MQDSYYELLSSNISRIDLNDVLFTHEGTGQKKKLQEIWDDVFKENTNIFDRVTESSDTLREAITVDFLDSTNRYLIPIENVLVPIKQMIFHADFTVKKVNPSQIKQYSETGGKILAQSVHFTIDTDSGDVALSWYNCKCL